MANNDSWYKIFEDHNILSHNFDKSPFELNAIDIKTSCQHFTEVSKKEVRVLCKQDTREERPQVFKDNGLFLLPIKNGAYAIIKGEGYVDVPDITSDIEIYYSKLDFKLDTSIVGNSEMQHLDFAYASSLIRTFMNDESLVLTIRGRKFTPAFDFFVNNQLLSTKSVQTEVDAGYEGRDKIVLIEAKNSFTNNTIIRQLFYPFKQWKVHTKKDVFLLFFEKRNNFFYIWQYGFKNENQYNSIELIKSKRYEIISPE